MATSEETTLIENIDSGKNIEEEFERYKEPNPFNYSELELAKRKKALIDAEKDFPNVPPKWIEWLYDVLEQKGEEEVKKIIENKEWEKKLNNKRMLSGTLKSVEVLDP